MAIRVLMGLGLFLGSMALGWWLNRRGALTETRASWLVRALVRGVSPVILCLLFWRMNLRDWHPWLLTLIGTAVSASTLLPAWLYTARARLTAPETGSFLTCAFFSNVGYLGAFTAFALFGETAYALCVLYFVFFTPCFYTLGFGIAARYGRPAGSTALGRAYHAVLRLYPFLGMLAGIGLSLSGLPRPAWCETANHILIPADTALYLMAIGSQLSFASPGPWLRACLVMSGIKFVYAPLVAWSLVTLFHVEGLARFVVLLEASTPVAVSPLVLPLLFGLDRKLANALWLFTTAVAIPWILLVIPLLQRL